MAKLIIKDEVNIKFEGLPLEVRKKLTNIFKYTLPYAKHHPAYKLGRWDGTTTLFSLGGAGYINQLDRILPILEDMRIDITEIEDHRIPFLFNIDKITDKYWADKGKVWPDGHEFAGKPILLRDYQLDIVNKSIDNPQSIIVAATGAGKTIVTATMAHICEPFGRTLTIVPSKSLVLQTEETFIAVGLDVGVYYSERKNLSSTHIISTWQSLEVLNKKSKKDLEDAIVLAEFLDSIKAVIVDEVHNGKAPVLHSLLTKNLSNAPIRWGLTGTLPKEECDYESILVAIGPPITAVKAHELQEQGVLANCHINIFQLYDYKAFKDYPSEYKWITSDDARLQFLATMIESIASTGNTLVLVGRIGAGETLAQLLNAPFICGDNSTNDRKKEYSQMKECDNHILVATYGVASVGINIIRLFNVVLIEPGKSFVRVIQTIGRGLRVGHDKNHVEIFDISSTCKFSKRHLAKRKLYYKEAQYPYTIKKIDWQAT